MTSKSLAKTIALSALTKKADNIVIMDLRKLTTMTDYFVVCSADSDTQVKAIADAIRESARNAGENLWRNEGYSDASWVLLDYVNVVAHVFHKQTREFYNLEKLWGDAKVEHVSDEAPAPKKAPAKSKKTTAETPAVKKTVRSKKKKADTEE